MLQKIISGGQTGVDRAALDVGLELGIPIGGFCPKGMRSEDGSIPAKYPMIETTSADYRVRTEKNVIEAGGKIECCVSRIQLVLHPIAFAVDEDGLGVVEEVIQDGGSDGAVVVGDPRPDRSETDQARYEQGSSFPTKANIS